MVGLMELELEEEEDEEELKMSDTMSEEAVMLLGKGNLNTLLRIFSLRSPWGMAKRKVLALERSLFSDEKELEEDEEDP